MPVRRFDLPSHLAKGIAGAWGKPDLSAAVVTTAMRPALKNVALPDKLGTLDGTLRVDRQAVDGHVIPLVDDLYQSGVSMNWVGMELLNAGARKVFGLACEKTCRNDDNVRGAR